MPGVLQVPGSEGWVFAVASCPGVAFRRAAGAKSAGFGLILVFQASGVVTPCLHSVEDTVSTAAVRAGGQQSAGVVGQLGAAHGENGMFCEGDRVGVVAGGKRMDAGEGSRAQVPELAHRPAALVVTALVAIAEATDGLLSE